MAARKAIGLSQELRDLVAPPVVEKDATLTSVRCFPHLQVAGKLAGSLPRACGYKMMPLTVGTNSPSLCLPGLYDTGTPAPWWPVRILHTAWS